MSRFQNPVRFQRGSEMSLMISIGFNQITIHPVQNKCGNLRSTGIIQIYSRFTIICDG